MNRMASKQKYLPKPIVIVGSTGSIGTNTLRVVRAHPGKFEIVGLAARRNAELLLRQAMEFRPRLVCLYESKQAFWLSGKLKRFGVRVVTGDDGLLEVSTMSQARQIIFSVVGAVGLGPIFSAIQAGKDIAVANKEPLVMAGELLMQQIRAKKVLFMPIDSEHSGLWQCLEGHPRHTIQKLILTSSGGPFFQKKLAFSRITPEQALRHPKWRMGPKITIDSATLMNKGLEVIEASNLFEMPVDKVDVVIHPEATVHALVEFVDGSQIAQLGITDMRLPIQYALSYPSRLVNTLPTLELTKQNTLHFFKPNWNRFPCLSLGYQAKRAGGTMPAVLNAANEIAVEKFLNRTISFTKIPSVIESVMTKHKNQKEPSLNDILSADRWARAEAEVVC